MLYLQLLKVQWKQSMRSSIWQKNILINIFLGLFIVYLILILLLLGGAMKEILAENFDAEGIMGIEKMGTWLLYFMAGDLIIRFFMQKIPEMSARIFLTLPVPRSKLAGFLLIRTLPSASNFLSLIFFIPFWARMWSDFPEGTQLPWLGMILCSVFINNFLTFHLKRLLSEKAWTVALTGLFLIVAGLLDYFGWLRLSVFSGWIYNAVLIQPLPVLVAWVSVLGVIWYLNFSVLKKRMILDEIRPASQKASESTRVNYFQKYGTIGQLITLELKLIFRHKRTRSTLFMVPLLLLYGFFFYPNPEFNDKTGWLIFAGLFVTGGFLMSYGQFLISWESSYFDAILTKSLNFRQYFLAKYYILVIPAVASYLLTIPYVFFGEHILLINTAAFLFNVGINVHVYMYFAAFNQKRLELAGGAMLNYQGVGAKHFLMMVPVMLVPVILYSLVALFAGREWGIAAVGLIGLSGLIFYKPLLSMSASHFQSRRYSVSEGFRIK